MANDGLKALLGMRSPANLSGGDPYLARRRADIVSGVDDFVPDADSEDFRMAQLDAGEKRYGGGTVSYTPSRAGMREGAMSKLRQALGVQERDIYGKIAAEEAGQRSAMDRVMLQQEGQNYRTQMQQGGSTARSEADRDSRENLLNTRMSAMETQQAARDAAAMERAKFNQGSITQRQDKKLGAGAGWMSNLYKAIFGGGEEEEVIEDAPVEEFADEQPAPRRRGRIISVE